jgi:hypothetical protein
MKETSNVYRQFESETTHIQATHVTAALNLLPFSYETQNVSINLKLTTLQAVLICLATLYHLHFNDKLTLILKLRLQYIVLVNL